MLNIFYNMAKVLIKPEDPEFTSISNEILNDSRYMPHFKDCIGAIDGVHVQASISPCDQVPYIGRKGTPTQNILAICDFNMQFTFACAGWEGTAHDSRVFLSAFRNPRSNFPKPPNGKYYVVDAGYPQMKGFLGPYKGERYHLPHFRRGDEPAGHKEIFNHAHSSLRSVIERTFGVWKKKWSILRDMPSFPYDKQVKIVIATMAIHNYIRRYAQQDPDFDESENYSIEEINEEMEDNAFEEDGPGRQEMEVLRNTIAQSLMNAST
ncbi:putative nuclease HARBI1 [Rosa chinensis]|uniref:putative nuclease HARBI1 n=1 Tax=Rosa chinensis TaxID=74649 RepID=UPI001AD91E05|nr:putative nuclease HARBI1 [Rosa chinensis]